MGSRRFAKPRRNRAGLWCAVAIVVLLAGYVVVLLASRPSVRGDELRLDTFVDLARRGVINDAHLLDQDSYVIGTYQRPGPPPTTAEYNVPYLNTANSRERLLDILLNSGIPIDIRQQPLKRLLVPATLLLPALIVVVVFVYLALSFQRGTGLFAVRSGARRSEAGDWTVTFADIAGQDAAVVELRDVTRFLSEPDRFTDFGARVPKGVLLYGPPGCGKTLLARAVAGEARAAFYSISGSDFLELYVGVGAARVRDLFREARESAPAIVFIDELDSIGRRRGKSDEQEQALNQILTEMDGFSPMAGVIVIGATNRPDVLDPALLRPGRFDRTIGLERPDEDGRLAILSLNARDKPLDAGVDLTRVAHRAIGLSGADLASVMNEGALLAVRAGRPAISQADLDEAVTRILEAPERQRRLSMRERSFGTSAGPDRRVTFGDVAGVEEAVEELAEVRDYLAEPERFTSLGARPPRGFLLVGPPGCGKTLLAQAVATEANAAFFSVAASELVEVFAGEGAGRVRDLFAEARSVAPAIVFLDEIDAVGARRSGTVEGNREREQTLNQILVELDGFDARAGVTVIAATNRPQILDPALVRPGRFDRTVVLGLPDRFARRLILGVHAKGKPLGGDIDLDEIARQTPGFSGADLASVMNEAALLAGRRRLEQVPTALVEEAVARVGVGVARARRLGEEDRAVVAYHEMGHAVVGRALAGAHTPHRVSILARGGAAGGTWELDGDQRVIQSRSVLLDQMAALLGGRAAEELVFGEPGTAATDDLRRVREMARTMVCDYGMSQALGPLVAGDGWRSGERPPDASDEEAAAIFAEVRLLIQEAYAIARSVLAAARPPLDRGAKALLERETLSGSELDEVLGSSPEAVTATDPSPLRPRASTG